MDNKLTYAYIETSSYCNLECSFCNRDEVVLRPKNMSVEDYKIVLSKLKNHPIKEIKLMGMGEPFMHPKFSEICRLTRETFPEAFIISSTNCQFTLNGNFKRALQHIDLMYLSIDGYIENYEKFRAPAKWPKLIKFLIEASKIDRFNCKLAINYTINPENVLDIPRVQELIDRFGLDEMRLNIVQNWSEDQDAKGLISGFSEEQIEFIKTNYGHLIKGKSEWDYPDCFWVKSGIYITANGEMKVCCMNTSTKAIGNVITQPSVNELRRSQRYTEISEGCLSGKPTEHCKNCSYKELTGILKKIV